MSNYTSVFKRKEANSLTTSNTNGSDTEVESPSFIPGTRAEIKRLKIKFYILLLISNLALFFAIKSAGNKNSEVTTENVELIAHLNYTKVKLPLRLHLEVPSNVIEVPVTLFAKGRKQVIERGYLHARKEDEVAQKDFLSEDEVTLYEVEIHNEDLSKIVSFDGQLLSAYPYNSKQITKKVTQSRMPYEIHF